MLIISKVFTILCLLCLCGNREYPGSFQNKAVSSKLFFQMSVKLSEREGLFEVYKLDLSSKLSFTYGGNVNYYKSVHHPIPTLLVGTGSTLAIFKTSQ